jgi:hypothetical protein
VIAIYLYCLVKSARRPATARVPGGLPGASRPEAVDATGGLWLIVAEVPLDTYGSGSLETRLADMDWVGRVALAHEQVVEAFVRRAGATVIPMKLFTMFSTRERAVADVAERRRQIDRVARQISGAEEWGMRVSPGSAPPPATVPLRHAPSGAAFLAAKKQARDASRGARLAGAEAAEAAFRRLAKFARMSKRREFDPSAGTRPPLLDAALLVPAGKRASFTQAARREVAACARAGAVLTITGPWPAYHFVQTEEPSQ